MLGRFVAGSLQRHGMLEFKCPKCHVLITVTDHNASHEDLVSTFPEGFFRGRRVSHAVDIPLDVALGCT